MNWIKKGLIYSPDKNIWWRYKYGMMPTPVYLPEKEVIRVYFGVTDEQNNGRATFIDVDPQNPSIVRYVSDSYIIDIGTPGYFDDSGVIPSSVVRTQDSEYLYYVGFQRAEKVPYMLFSGLAISNNGQDFVKYAKVPIIERTINNPISNAAPFVIYTEGVFRMWFWLGREWTKINNKPYIMAEIHHAFSEDGIRWTTTDKPCIELDKSTEFSVGRPWIVKENGMYKMWYSVRHIDRLYRLGYAESIDGLTWERKDKEVGIDVSESGWDSEMICYPAVITVKNRTYLFYNGNNNGETGFGYAELSA